MTLQRNQEVHAVSLGFYSGLMNTFHSPESATNKNHVVYVTCVTSLIKFVCVHILMFSHEVEKNADQAFILSPYSTRRTDE